MKMAKFRIKIGNVEIEMEGEKPYIDKKFNEITKKLIVLQPQVLTPPPETKTEELTKENLKGIIEYREDKPFLVIQSPSSRLSLSEVISLLLYASKESVSLKELTKLVSKNWRSVNISTISGVINTTLKGRVLKEGVYGKYLYSLSGAGRDFVENRILPKLKREVK